MNNSELNIERREDKRFYIAIPFSLKDDFKKVLTSAKWHGSEKKWSVGPRSGKKLDAWVASHNKAIADEQERKDAFQARLEECVCLTHSYAFKDELKAAGAFFYKSPQGSTMTGWYLPRISFLETLDSLGLEASSPEAPHGATSVKLKESVTVEPIRKKIRVKVEAGNHEVGDVVENIEITGFGNSWKEKIYKTPKTHGQLWEECSCGYEPIYLPFHKCERCIARSHGSIEKVEVCYAYGYKVS